MSNNIKTTATVETQVEYGNTPVEVVQLLQEALSEKLSDAESKSLETSLVLFLSKDAFESWQGHASLEYSWYKGLL